MTVITGENVNKARLLTLRKGLELEIKCPGMQIGRRSASAIIKDMLGLAKNKSKKKTLEEFNKYMVEQGVPQEIVYPA